MTEVLVDTSTAIGGLYFGITLTAEPVVGLTSSVLVTHVLEDNTIPQVLIDVLLTALQAEICGGGRYGFPVKNVRFTVTAVGYRETTSTETAIRTAVASLFQSLLATGSFVTMGNDS